jgi:hypothetical protein
MKNQQDTKSAESIHLSKRHIEEGCKSDGLSVRYPHKPPRTRSAHAGRGFYVQGNA